jgi:phage gp36-like protein
MPVATLYCTQAEMERLFSTAGVLAFSDHEQTGETDTDVTTDCINQATEEINAYAMQRYSASALSGSTLINRWATVLAVYFLCERRGNAPPASLAGEFERIMLKLEKIPSGGFRLPDVAYRSDFRPGFSNMTVDRRYQFSKVRVVPTSSDGVPTVLPQKTIASGGMAYE